MSRSNLNESRRQELTMVGTAVLSVAAALFAGYLATRPQPRIEVKQLSELESITQAIEVPADFEIPIEYPIQIESSQNPSLGRNSPYPQDLRKSVYDFYPEMEKIYCAQREFMHLY